MTSSAKWLVIDCLTGAGVGLLLWAAFRWSQTLGIATMGTLILLVVAMAINAMGRPPLVRILLLSLALSSGCVHGQAATPEIYCPQSPEPIPVVRHGNRLIVRHNCTISLNPKTKLADWVLYRVDRRQFEGERVVSPARNWWAQFPGDTIPAKSYDGTKWARGHLAPLASFAASPYSWEVNGMENIAPQTEALNGGPWLRLENWERKQAEDGEIVIVLTGPMFDGATERLGEARVPVPTHFWKIISLGKNGTRRAWLFPQSPKRKDIESFEVSADELKTKVGLK